MLLPVQAVGVMGDARTYESVVALRAVETDDFMTADWSRLPHDLLARASTRITNTVKGVNRVVYDITSKPPGHDRVGVRRIRPGRCRMTAALEVLRRLGNSKSIGTGASWDRVITIQRLCSKTAE